MDGRSLCCLSAEVQSNMGKMSCRYRLCPFIKIDIMLKMCFSLVLQEAI